MNHNQAADQTNVLDIRPIVPRDRHPLIFDRFDALPAGAAFVFINDHDPLPLLHQVAQHFGDTVSANYRQRTSEAVIIDFVKLG